MYQGLHDRFQTFLDQTIDLPISLSEKKLKIKQHLLNHQNEYEAMLLSFFEEEELTNETYYYITYTYHDLPIDMTKKQEVVLSMLYDLENGMYFELVVFNEEMSGQETKEVFSRSKDFYS